MEGIFYLIVFFTLWLAVPLVCRKFWEEEDKERQEFSKQNKELEENYLKIIKKEI